MCFVTNICMYGRNPKLCQHPKRVNCIYACRSKPYMPKGHPGSSRCLFFEKDEIELEKQEQKEENSETKIVDGINKTLDEKELEEDLSDEKEEEEEKSPKIPGINKSLDEKEVEKENQEEEDEKKHYLVEVEGEKGAEDDGEPELDDEGHGKDLNKIMTK